MRVSAVRGSVLFLSLAAAMALVTISRGSADDDELKDPFLGQPDAIAAGRVTYAGKCYVCHHSTGARGPNLFATKLSDQRFLETVIQGRSGTQMPAFGLRMSLDEVWQIHAFVKSTDHY
jgi:mono/diheme cytochrome c family protein